MQPIQLKGIHSFIFEFFSSDTYKQLLLEKVFGETITFNLLFEPGTLNTIYRNICLA